QIRIPWQYGCETNPLVHHGLRNAQPVPCRPGAGAVATVAEPADPVTGGGTAPSPAGAHGPRRRTHARGPALSGARKRTGCPGAACAAGHARLFVAGTGQGAAGDAAPRCTAPGAADRAGVPPPASRCGADTC